MFGEEGEIFVWGEGGVLIFVWGWGAFDLTPPSPPSSAPPGGHYDDAIVDVGWFSLDTDVDIDCS